MLGVKSSAGPLSKWWEKKQKEFAFTDFSLLLNFTKTHFHQDTCWTHMYIISIYIYMCAHTLLYPLFYMPFLALMVATIKMLSYKIKYDAIWPQNGSKKPKTQKLYGFWLWCLGMGCADWIWYYAMTSTSLFVVFLFLLLVICFCCFFVFVFFVFSFLFLL